MAVEGEFCALRARLLRAACCVLLAASLVCRTHWQPAGSGQRARNWALFAYAPRLSRPDNLQNSHFNLSLPLAFKLAHWPPFDRRASGRKLRKRRAERETGHLGAFLIKVQRHRGGSLDSEAPFVVGDKFRIQNSTNSNFYKFKLEQIHLFPRPVYFSSTLHACQRVCLCALMRLSC